MLKHSYGSIIKSLVGMQNRRSKKKAAKEAAAAKETAEESTDSGAGGGGCTGRGDGKVTFLTTLSTMDTCQGLPTKSCLELKDKYDIDRFVNPLTREETFKALFDEVSTPFIRPMPLLTPTLISD